MMKIVLRPLVMLALIPVGSFGAATVYSDRPSFEAAIGPHVTYTFDTDGGFPTAPANINSFGPVIATSSDVNGGPAYLRNFPDGSDNQTLSGVPVVGDTLISPLFITFTVPQYAVAFDDYPGGSAITVRFDNGNSSYTLSDQGELVAFFGLTSSEPILGFSVSSVGDFRSQRYDGIDNLTIVPEPFGISFLPLLPLPWHRRRKPKDGKVRKAQAESPAVGHRAIVDALENRRLLSTSFVFAGEPSLNVGTNVNISNIANSQAEEAIAVDPVDPAKMFAFSNDGPGMCAEYSSDAGATWTKTNPPAFSAVSDPSTTFDRFGNLFVHISTTLGPMAKMSCLRRALMVARHLNRGATRLQCYALCVIYFRTKSVPNP